MCPPPQSGLCPGCGRFGTRSLLRVGPHRTPLPRDPDGPSGDSHLPFGGATELMFPVVSGHPRRSIVRYLPGFPLFYLGRVTRVFISTLGILISIIGEDDDYSLFTVTPSCPEREEFGRPVSGPPPGLATLVRRAVGGVLEEFVRPWSPVTPTLVSSFLVHRRGTVPSPEVVGPIGPQWYGPGVCPDRKEPR